MVQRLPPIDRNAPVVVVGIGNTSITLATWHDGLVKSPLSILADDSDAFSEALAAHTDALEGTRPAATVIASVAPKTLEQVRERLSDAARRPPLVIGDTIPLPIEVGVDRPGEIGVDRVCSAAAAFDRLESACTVIDFGSAVTVDLVDDDGVLVGGAILPGVRMQLWALHQRAAQLPEVEPGFPQHAYGRNTSEAIQTGVCRGIIGAVRGIAEGYATSLNRWPQILATGGDLEFLLPHCDFIDTPVEHLTMLGIGLAYSKHLTAHGV